MYNYLKKAVEEALKEDAPEKEVAPKKISEGKYEIASFKLFFMAPPTIVKPGEPLPKEVTLEKGESVNRNFQWRFFRFLFSLKNSKDLKFYVFHMELEPDGTQRSVKVFDSDSNFSILNSKIQSKDILPKEVMVDKDVVKILNNGNPLKRPEELKPYGTTTYVNLDPKDSGSKSSGKNYTSEEFKKDFINAAYVLFNANAGAPPVNAFGDPISVTTVPKKAPIKPVTPAKPAETPKPEPAKPGVTAEPVNPLIQKESNMDDSTLFASAVRAARDKMAKPFSGGFDIMERLVEEQRKKQKKDSKD